MPTIDVARVSMLLQGTRPWWGQEANSAANRTLKRRIARTQECFAPIRNLATWAAAASKLFDAEDNDN
jgi:hypothetical protein